MVLSSAETSDCPEPGVETLAVTGEDAAVEHDGLVRGARAGREDELPASLDGVDHVPWPTTARAVSLRGW
ncbi:hypothetical protein [Geodermatophilus normandii]|uniref:hypothetical protein n=1 Tax=Geodermatophilus normandii TaxID=1137989 RepID=UPI000D714BD9|nr:hypothetical protein [Geodermatophilus normandii]